MPVLTVAYRGPQTIARLTEDYEDRRFLPIADEMFAITVDGDRKIEFSYSEQPRPVVSHEFGEIFPRTDEIIEEIATNGFRPFNVPEALALGNALPTLSFACLGQIIETQFGRQVLYVIRHGAGLLPKDRSWGASWCIPITSAPDPLATQE